MAIFFPGDATAADVVVPKKFSAGVLTNTPGTMVNRGAVTIIPSQSAQAIAAGYHNGSGTVPAVSFDATKVLNDTTIAGKVGTMPNITAGADPALGLGQWGDGGLAVYPSAGYRKGGAGAGEIKVSIGQLQATVAGLTASNIRSGVALMGLTGTLVEGKKYASGSITSAADGAVQVTGLAFNPGVVIMLLYAGGFYYRYFGYYERWVYGEYVTDYNGAPYVAGHASSIAAWGNGFSVNIGMGNISITWLAYA